ncbi:hypothetical protein LH47_01740 [Anoxybacillus thermarum]|uniref:Uncharacterized protein n=1 Tax=Anoxybacillus thermarum TaxID=404937 RepID=A0A0D0Q849_9BACL|nr:hypothetical protein LH47_01740 [Anoxybacillus thermarum]
MLQNCGDNFKKMCLFTIINMKKEKTPCDGQGGCCYSFGWNVLQSVSVELVAVAPAWLTT